MDNIGYQEPVSRLEDTLLLRRLKKIPAADTTGILALEQEIYEGIKQKPDNVNYRILLLYIQLMQGNRERAKALSYAVWEEGGATEYDIRLLYARCLTGLGLLEMAKMLLLPQLASMSEISFEEGLPFIEYALAAGDEVLLGQAAALLKDENIYMALHSFNDFYKSRSYWPHYRKFQEIIFEALKDTLCRYICRIENDRGFTDIIAEFYLTLSEEECAELEDEINQKIIDYCAAQEIKKYYNYTISLKNVKSLPALADSGLPA